MSVRQMEFKPHRYQSYCIQKILEIKKLGLFLDMGLGKTVTTLTAIKELKYLHTATGSSNMEVQWNSWMSTGSLSPILRIILCD